jgi:hypothetical protein
LHLHKAETVASALVQGDTVTASLGHAIPPSVAATLARQGLTPDPSRRHRRPIADQAGIHRLDV